MVELTTFGAIDLRRDGTDARSVLSQPKRLALLVYLRLAAPGGFVARDRLLATFWPESDGERARNALRQSLHFLRRSLGEDALTSRGERDIGASATVACDAVAFSEALDDDRLEHALELYRGDFLPGFFLEEVPELEQWIEGQRAGFARAAARAAWTLSARAAAAGQLAAAIMWARRGLAIDPLDEAGARRLMTLLAESGDRAAALEIYQETERRLGRDLDLKPSPETSRLAEAIRTSAPHERTVAPHERTVAPHERTVAPHERIVAPHERTVAPHERIVAPNERAIPAPEPMPGIAPAAVPVIGGVSAAPGPAPARPKVRAIAAAAAVVLLAAIAWFTLRPEAPPLEGPPSIAVMPFLDLSDSRNADYFADGVSEELLNVLARVPGLRVAARTSSFAFRDKDVPIDSIARALKVTHVLEGSVRSDGSHVRITAQLIEARSGFHLWSETYDRELDDIFEVQDEISAAIAKQLQIELAGNFWGISERETKDPEAYRLLLRALHTFRMPSPENYATSAALIEDALRRDPDYARAHGTLANVLLWQAAFGWIPTDRAYARADSLARRGLAIAETPEAHLALARLAEILAWNPDSADAHFRRARELNPADARSLQYHALFLARSNRGDEAIAAARRATELDPLHPGSWVNYASVLSMLSREDEGLAAMEKARAVAPNDVIVLTNLANQYGNVGRIDDALATAARALEIDSTNLNLLGLRVHLLFQAGRTAEARTRLAELEKRPEFSRFRLATLYANTQDIERILDLLEEAAERREDEISRIRAPDMFRGLRHHPRFQKLLRSLENGP